MATKLYVGNLNYRTTDQDLNEMFSEFGAVTSAQVLVDRYSGQSRGFGFVEMSTDDEAQKAIAGLNGRTVEGRPLTVNESRPREDRGGSGGGGGGSRYGGGGGGGRSSSGGGGGRNRY
jgi:RNA recognition motif-containing protein